MNNPNPSGFTDAPLMPMPNPVANFNAINSPLGSTMPSHDHGAVSQPVMPSHVAPVKDMFMASACKVMPASTALHARSHLPQGILVRPLADPDSGPVPVTDFNRSGVIRCTKCRAYISAYCPLQDNGSTWSCCFCQHSNPIPDTYYAPLDAAGLRTDLAARPELHQSSYEVIATSDYAVRQPMPPTYFFVIDVSVAAQRSGMLKTVAETIEKCLDELPGGSDQGTADTRKRTRVGFITYDSAVHVYEFRATSAGPHMYVQSDLDNLLLPVGSGLLVNLQECRSQISAFLDALPEMNRESDDVEVALGPALTTAVEVIKHMGGKLVVFATGLPSIGKGRLVNREARTPKGDKVEGLLTRDPAGDGFYDHLGQLMVKHQISTELFLVANTNFLDVGTLHDLPKLSGGQTHYYSQYHPALHADRLAADLRRCLTRLTGWEAVIRLRLSQGAVVTDFYGNFTMRNQSLLALSAVDSDKTFGFEIRPDDSVMGARCVYAQSALLYTSFGGERRIRVHTMCIPVTQSITELYESVDVNCTMNLLAKQSAVMAIAPPVHVNGGLVNARQHLFNRCLNILRTYRSVMNRPNYDYGPLSALSLMCLGVLKSLAFRDAPDVRADQRAAVLYHIITMGLLELETFVRPRVLDVSSLAGEVGMCTGDSNVPVLPTELSATESNLSPNGVYLMDNGVDMVLRVGHAVAPEYLQDLFGLPSLSQVPNMQIKLRASTSPSDTSPCQRLHNIINALRAYSPSYQVLRVVREGDPMDSVVQAMFIEDPQANVASLSQFATLVHKG